MIPIPEYYGFIRSTDDSQSFNYYDFYYPHINFHPYAYLDQLEYFNPYANSYAYPPEQFGYSNNISQKRVRGQATWTEGGKTTKCGISWSYNNYITTAVGPNSPYKCGQTLKVSNISISTPKEIVVTVVDTVQGFPPNRLNLHKKAFEALGSPTSVGIIEIEITPMPDKEYGKWGKVLLGLTKNIYPNYNVVDFKFVSSQKISKTKTKETFDYILQSPQKKLKVRVTVIYNPKTEKIISINFEDQDFKEK